MKIVCISDMHGKLVDLPESDITIIAGDICPTTNHNVDFQANWINTNFKNWANSIKTKHLVYIAGNHDFVFQNKSKDIEFDKIKGHYLQDSSVELLGLKIYGTPWTPYFYDWAFNLYEEDLSKKWNLIPSDADIIVAHGPPMGYGDWAPRVNGKGGENTGSPSLLVKIEEVKPKLVVFGHIHEGRGNWNLNGTKLVNATLLNRNYEMVYDPWVYELENPT